MGGRAADYFFYHHTNADTMHVLDSRQMDRAAAIVAAHAFAMASLPNMPSRGVPLPASGTEVVDSCFRCSGSVAAANAALVFLY